MSSKNNLEKDYDNFTHDIENMVEQHLEKIREKARIIKSDAAAKGETVELSLNRGERK